MSRPDEAEVKAAFSLWTKLTAIAVIGSFALAVAFLMIVEWLAR